MQIQYKQQTQIKTKKGNRTTNPKRKQKQKHNLKRKAKSAKQTTHKPMYPVLKTKS